MYIETDIKLKELIKTCHKLVNILTVDLPGLYSVLPRYQTICAAGLAFATTHTKDRF